MYEYLLQCGMFPISNYKTLHTYMPTPCRFAFWYGSQRCTDYRLGFMHGVEGSALHHCNPLSWNVVLHIDTLLYVCMIDDMDGTLLDPGLGLDLCTVGWFPPKKNHHYNGQMKEFCTLISDLFSYFSWHLWLISHFRSKFSKNKGGTLEKNLKK